MSTRNPIYDSIRKQVEGGANRASWIRYYVLQYMHVALRKMRAESIYIPPDPTPEEILESLNQGYGQFLSVVEAFVALTHWLWDDTNALSTKKGGVYSQDEEKLNGHIRGFVAEVEKAIGEYTEDLERLIKDPGKLVLNPQARINWMARIIYAKSSSNYLLLADSVLPPKPLDF